MVRDDTLDASKLKKAAGGRQKRTVDEIIDLLPKEGVGAKEWQKLADTEAGIGKTRFYELIKETGTRVYRSKIDDRYHRK